jgi:hypothetical protein
MSNFKAIRYLYPTAEFVMSNDDISTIIWHTEGITTPSKEQIQNAIKAMEAAEVKNISDKEFAKTSAIAKLTALGLTAEEIAALLSK